MTAEQALERMVELFDEGRWLNRHNAYLKEGYCAVRANGTPTMHYDPQLAVGYCMGGAMAKVTDQPLCQLPNYPDSERARWRPEPWPLEPVHREVLARIEHLAGTYYGWYNDAPGRTYEEVRALLVEARELGAVTHEV